MTSASVVLQRRVDWLDTDAAGIYHHSTVWRLVEAAEATLHDRLGFELRVDGEVAVLGELVTVLLDRPRGSLMVWPEPWRRLLLHAGPQAPELLTEAQEGSVKPR